MKVEDRISLFVKKERRQPEAWEICPKADFCNINKCPLHPSYSALENDSSDFAIVHRQKCLEKPIRKQIGQHFRLKNEGLTFRELSGMRKWESLTEKERIDKSNKLRENSPFVQLKSKGYAITRLSKDTSSVTLSKEENTQNSSKEDTLSKTSIVCESQEAKPGFPNQNEFEGVGEL